MEILKTKALITNTWNTSSSVENNLENSIPWVLDFFKNNSLGFPEIFEKCQISSLSRVCLNPVNDTTQQKVGLIN